MVEGWVPSVLFSSGGTEGNVGSAAGKEWVESRRESGGGVPSAVGNPEEHPP